MSHLHRDARGARLRKLVTAWANTTPGVQCWRCRRTALEHGRRWHAGHTTDGDPLAQPWLSNDDHPTWGSWLRAECEECNTRHGALRGNELRQKPQTSRSW